jgi:hypothetical protein
MKHKAFKDKVKKLGGVINDSCCVDFPETLQIKTKQEAIDIIDVMRYGNDLEDGFQYSIGLDVPLDKLKAAIKRGNL